MASYKFALARALLAIRPEAGRVIRLEEIALPFALEIARHLKDADRQGTSASSGFLDACRGFNAGEIGEDELRDESVRRGFANVIDAFHIVGRGQIPVRFFEDVRSSQKGIRATPALEALVLGDQAGNLPFEVEARWRLVETAWTLGVPASTLSVAHDASAESLIVAGGQRRRSVGRVRDALSGYQKGCCFHCFAPFDLSRPAPSWPDVDHVFPHRLKALGLTSVDGLWNLVLSCRACNRGPAGKFDAAPASRLVERLWRRNEFYVGSHHPLRETILAQTGNTPDERRRFLEACLDLAGSAGLHPWLPASEHKPAF